MSFPDKDHLKLNAQFGKPEKYVYPGTLYVSGSDIVISTLLGSCVSVALYDPHRHIGGLNHFMLPARREADAPAFSESAKYGINAMELLINSCLKNGAEKSALRAKVFGGSTILDFQREAIYNVPKKNIEFAFGFLANENIPVDAYSVGGVHPRRIFFFPYELKILMKFSKRAALGLERRELLYSHKLMEGTKNAGKPIIF